MKVVQQNTPAFITNKPYMIHHATPIYNINKFESNYVLITLINTATTKPVLNLGH